MSDRAKISVHAVEGKSQITSSIPARIKSESLFNISLAILILIRMIKLTGAVTDKFSDISLSILVKHALTASK